MTFKLFVMMRKRYPNTLGVREAQEQLRVSSPSTVSWHLEKLLDAGYVIKSPANRYQLSDNANALDTIRTPTLSTYRIFEGVLISYRIFYLAFILTLLLLSSIFAVFSYSLAFFNLTAGLLILVGIIMWDMYKENHELAGLE